MMAVCMFHGAPSHSLFSNVNSQICYSFSSWLHPARCPLRVKTSAHHCVLKSWPVASLCLSLTALCTHSLHLLCFVIFLKALHSSHCVFPSLTWPWAHPHLCQWDITTRLSATLTLSSRSVESESDPMIRQAWLLMPLKKMCWQPRNKRLL